MPKRRRNRHYGYPGDVMMRLESFGRVGWAKWYDQKRETEGLRQANAVLVDRIETLLPEALGLIDDVLYRSPLVAFGHAYKLDRMIEDYYRGARSWQ
jgi:hypothetical protein